MAENIGLTLVLGASIGASMAHAFGSVEQRIKRTQRSMGEATRKAKLLQSAIDLHEQRDALQAKYKAGGSADAALRNDLEKVEKEYAKASEKAKEYGRSVDEWRRAHTEANRALESSYGRLQRLQALENERATRRNLAGQGLQMVAPVAALAAPVKEAMEFESAMADVAKVTDYDAAGLKNLGAQLMEMSTQLPMAATGLAEIAAAAGQAGIAKEELVVFSRDAAQMGIAFDIAAADAGAALTGLRNNFGLTQDGVRLLGDAMNALSNKMDAKARDIVDFANRTGGTARIYGFTGQEVSALGASFLAAKVGAEEASTATNALLVRLGTADKLPKDAQAAFAALGISGENMAKAFKEDAQGALLAFLQIVKSSDDPMRHLNAIFGADHAPKIARLVNALDSYQGALGIVADAEGYRGSMQEEAEKRSQTTLDQLRMLKNAVQTVAITLGSVLLPAMNDILQTVTPAISAFASFADQHQGVVAAVAKLAVGLVAGKAAFLAFRYGASLAHSGMLVLKGGMAVATAMANSSTAAMLRSGAVAAASAIKVRALGLAHSFAGAKALAGAGLAKAAQAGWAVLSVGVRAVGMAFRFATGPIGLVLTALSIGAGLLIKHWDKIGPYFQKLWDGVTKIFNAALEFMQPVFDKVGAAFEALSGLWDSVFGDDEEEKKQEKPASVPTLQEKQEAAAASQPSLAALAASTDPAEIGLPSGMQSAGGMASGASVQMNFTLSGMPDAAFAQRVVQALQNHAPEVEALIDRIVSQQARVAYE